MLAYLFSDIPDIYTFGACSCDYSYWFLDQPLGINGISGIKGLSYNLISIRIIIISKLVYRSRLQLILLSIIYRADCPAG